MARHSIKEKGAGNEISTETVSALKQFVSCLWATDVRLKSSMERKCNLKYVGLELMKNIEYSVGRSVGRLLLFLL